MRRPGLLHYWPPCCFSVPAARQPGGKRMREMKVVILGLCLIVMGVSSAYAQTSQPASPVGRWQVKFTLIDTSEQNLVFTAHEGGDGSFQLRDTGSDNKPVPNPRAAAWSLGKGDLSISGEVELQIGTCCRETGTVIFKAKLTSSNSISGKVIFITNIDEEESPYRYRGTIGTFTATRLPEK